MPGTHPLLSVGKGDEYGCVGELEGGADGVDGDDEDDPVGDEGEAVPHADEAVEQRVDVWHGRELLRGSIPNNPSECRPARDGHYSFFSIGSVEDRKGKTSVLEVNLTKEIRLIIKKRGT